MEARFIEPVLAHAAYDDIATVRTRSGTAFASGVCVLALAAWLGTVNPMQ